MQATAGVAEREVVAGASGSTPPLAVSIGDAAKLGGIGRTMLYAELAAGRGPRTFRINRRRLILVEDLREWLRDRAASGRGQ